MTSIETSVTRGTATNLPTSSHWEKEFFTTWLRLMERQKDETDLTQALQSLLTQDGDAIIKLQDAKHHANMMSANDKTMTELMAQLHEFFFRDVVPALKKMRKDENTSTVSLQRQEDPLDRYLEHGDDGTAMSQAFVDNMSGWAVPVESGRQEKMKKKVNEKKKKKKMKNVKVVSYVSSQVGEEEGDAELENDEDSDDEISSDMFHDMLIANSLKLTAMQAPDYSTMTPGHVSQQRVAAVPKTMVSQGSTAGNRASAHSPTAAAVAGRLRTRSSTSASPKAIVDKGKVKKALKCVPSPARICLSSRSRSVSGSTPGSQMHSPSDPANKKKSRIGKIAAASLVADQVLDVRTYGTTKEYLIRWQNRSTPLWISRRKSPPQAKELIDAYAATLRKRNSTSEPQENARGGSPAGRKKSARHGAKVQMGDGPGANETKFYTVDHIVNHRTRYNKRQYLVRWENYSESSDTWENANKLRIDVPDIVEAYEEKLQCDDTQTDADHLAKIVDDTMVGSKRKSTTTKRRIGNEDVADKGTLDVKRVADERTKEKRRRITTDDEGKSDGADEDILSKDDCQIDLEEAELDEECSDGESSDN
ncbi:hypothetical protein KXD40_009191 [Peronospora effusa]|uniref:Chromo domain-containing protein n=1 Tax=Peronospora effusa TaxID=542832 RepID=A0A3M6VEK9_9STRA|nr:hypothetical protein DD238_006690 [Peronospora effusa]RQM16889.1 hypothetical protein DD237_004877 [Peronospora effusa]UIZ25183.1 hypothetical protein KXD40_009191 [Peronospora effusa]CAI5707103.1 unnamed protein product [Peronospora effusa]